MLRRALPAAVALAVAAPVAACTGGPPFQHLAGPGKATLVAYHADLAELPRFTVLRDPAIRPHKPPAARSSRSTSTFATKPQVTPPRALRPTVPVAPGGEAGLLWRIALCESRGQWTAHNPTSSASGAWQDLDSTWHGYGGYSRAMYAPPAVQLAFNAHLLAVDGTAPWAPSRSCWG